jgi:Protein of unknown function (DUF2948)
VLGADMRFEADARRFVVMANRYQWEAGQGARVKTALVIDHVARVRLRGIDQARPEQFLSLLTVRFLEQESVIELAFSGGGAIRLEVSGVLCHLQDFGEPWPAGWQPHHDQEP